MTTRAPREVRYGGAMLDEREIAAVTNVMRTGLAVGAQVRGFEQRCAEVRGKRHGIMVNSGSSALLVALRLLDLPPGSEVITPVVTFSTDVSSIIHAGCVPAFVDVELDSYQIDLARIERMITPNTSAMLVPNLLGNIPDWDALRALADKHGLKLIEDSCDTLGSRLRGSPPGTRADLSCTSFSIFHIITCLGTGGLVATNDPKQWDRGLVMRSWGRSSDKFLHGTRQNDAEKRFGESIDDIPYDSFFIFDELGYGFIPSEAGAAFGHVQLDKLDDFFALRQSRFARHQEFFARYEHAIIRPRVLDGAETTWICYPIQLRPELGLSRPEFQRHLEDAGIWTRVIFTGNVLRQPMMRNVAHRADPDGYPNADQLMRHGIVIPCHPTMTDEDCDYVYDVIADWLDQHQIRPV